MQRFSFFLTHLRASPVPARAWRAAGQIDWSVRWRWNEKEGGDCLAIQCAIPRGLSRLHARMFIVHLHSASRVLLLLL